MVTYTIPYANTMATPSIPISTPPTLISVSQSVAENDVDYLTTLTNTARDVRETIIATIMTGVHLIRDLVVLQITALHGYFDQVWAHETHTETLCIGTTGNETCITKDQLDTLLHMAIASSGTVATPVTPTTSFTQDTSTVTMHTMPIGASMTATGDATVNPKSFSDTPKSVEHSILANTTSSIISHDITITTSPQPVIPTPGVDIITTTPDASPTVTETPVLISP